MISLGGLLSYEGTGVNLRERENLETGSTWSSGGRRPCGVLYERKTLKNGFYFSTTINNMISVSGTICHLLPSWTKDSQIINSLSIFPYFFAFLILIQQIFSVHWAIILTIYNIIECLLFYTVSKIKRSCAWT